MTARNHRDEPWRSAGYLERIAGLVKHPLFRFLIILCIIYLIATIYVVTRQSEVSAVVLLLGQGLVCIIIAILGAAVYWCEKKVESQQAMIKYSEEIEEQFKRRLREAWHKEIQDPPGREEP